MLKISLILAMRPIEAPYGRKYMLDLFFGWRGEDIRPY